MSVYDLAPALLAIGAACTRANRIVNGDTATVDVQVRAEFEAGSFGVGLALLQMITNRTPIDLVKDANAVAQMAGFMVKGARGALGVIKQSKGARPTSVVAGPGNTVNATFNNCQIITTHEALAIAADPEFRAAMSCATSVLSGLGPPHRTVTVAFVGPKMALPFAPTGMWAIGSSA